MSSPTFDCPKCGDPLIKQRGSSETITCPSCGARVRLAAQVTSPEPGDGAVGLDRAVARNARRAARTGARKKAKTPWWAWAALVAVLVGGAALAWVGYQEITKRGAADGAAGETPKNAGTAPANGNVGQPRVNVPNGNVGRPGGDVAARSPFAANAEPKKMPAPAAPVPAELADIVFLLPDDHPGPTFLMLDAFERELARQALGVAAREDFGLRVRDAALGDVAPAALPADRQLRVRRVPDQPGPWAVVAGLPGTEHQFWAGSLLEHQYQVSPDECLAGHERLARGFFAKCLAGAGFTAKPNRTSDAPVPAAVEKALGQMREADQFAAVRMLHDEIRTKGESDALIAGLVRGYANLALLTEFHWNDAPYVFKARAVLYAQRLIARAPNAPDARRLRAYAAALAGWHTLALQDLTAAAKLAAAAPPAPAPAWAEAVDHYVHFDLAKLAAARAKSDTPLLRILEFLALEAPEAEAATIRAGRALLEAEPECYLVHDAMCRVGGVAHLHRATLAGPAVFSSRLATLVGEIPGLPAKVKTALDGGAVEPRVYAALRGAGASDRGEPTWAALSGLLQEIRFTQAAHRLSFVTDSWNVDPSEEAAEFATLLHGHRLRPFIESYTFDLRRTPDAVRNRLVAPKGEIDLRAHPYLVRLAKVDQAAAQELQSVVRASLYPEEARRAHLFRRDRSGAVRPYIPQLVATSPHAPIGQALSAAYGESQPAAKLTEMEARYADHPVVQWGLGKRHLADGRRADAIRCWGRWVKLSPSGDAFRELAGLYREAGDEALWRETLEACLKEEDTGLFHAQVRVDLAMHYMQKKDFKRAEPYAMAAAQSGASWALVCAAECQEGLGRWDEANQLYEANANRYPGSAFVWYFACRATGKMDRVAAEAAVRGHLEQYGPGTTAGELFQAGRFHLLAGDPKTARPLFDRGNQLGPTALSSIFAALLADAAGDAKGRTTAFDEFAKLPAAKVQLGPIGVTLRDWSAKGVVPDAAAVETALGNLPAEFRADGEFYFGWYLSNRNLKDRAGALWKRCLESTGTPLVKTHARAGLESLSPKRD